MTLYETIFARRSVRKYDMTPLDDETLNLIKTFVSETEQLEGQTARFEFVTADKVSGTPAPHYILSYCQPHDKAYANVGYVLEKADLFIQSLGLGSVWLGMAKPLKPEDDYCILLAFGRSGEPFRKNETDFNRLPLSEISNEENDIAKAARLAPSAVNTQPWKLGFSKDRVTISYFGRGLMKRILKGKMSKVDVGIVSRHVVTALLDRGSRVTRVLPRMNDGVLEIVIDYVEA